MPACDWSEEKKAEVIIEANKISQPHGLVATLLGDGVIQTVGVQGDNRSYTPVVVLIGQFPGHEVLATVSNAITNSLPVNRVTWLMGIKNPDGTATIFLDDPR